MPFRKGFENYTHHMYRNKCSLDVKRSFNWSEFEICIGFGRVFSLSIADNSVLCHKSRCFRRLWPLLFIHWLAKVSRVRDIYKLDVELELLRKMFDVKRAVRCDRWMLVTFHLHLHLCLIYVRARCQLLVGSFLLRHDIPIRNLIEKRFTGWWFHTPHFHCANALLHH